MKDTQFYAVIISGVMAILLLFGGGWISGNKSVVICAVIAAGLMYLCQMSDAVAGFMGGKWRAFQYAALGAWVASIVAWVAGLVMLVWK